MKKLKEKSLSLLLIFSMILGLIPETVTSAFAESDITLGNDTTNEIITSFEVSPNNVENNEENNESIELEKSMNVLEESNNETVVESTVAIVGDKAYSTLEEAIQNITDNSTIRIVSDITLNESVIIPQGLTAILTSDNNNHTITMSSTNENKQKPAFIVEKGATLIIDSPNLTFVRENFNDYLSGLIISYGNLELNNGVLDFGGNKLNSDNHENYANGIVQVCGDQSVFKMNGGIIKNAKTWYNAGGVRVCCNGKFIMNNGTISDIHGGGQLNTGAVLVVANNNDFWRLVGSASFEMNGGVIENNTGYRGSGVYVVGVEYNNRATMVMNNGKIQNNVCTGWYNNTSFKGAGAGIYIEKNAFVTMNGGSISNNIVNGGMGGGVATADAYYDTFPNGPDSPGAWTIEAYSRLYPAGFTMNGGTINNNKSTLNSVGGDGGCGGGIYASSNKVTLKGGIIENNEAEKQGGGIYVSSIPYKLKINDALLTGNTASILGGGIWTCPTGDAEVFVTNGVGVYDNTSNGAGDDIVSVKTKGRNYVLTLSDRILGGGQVLWYKDGGLANDNSILGYPDDSARYNENTNDTPITNIKNSRDPYALKSIVSDNARKLAENNAKLFIRNNKSARGGGIGTNGGVIMGKKNNDFTLKVKKHWNKAEESLKQPITVYLKTGDTVLDSVKLSKDNNWESEFKDLPNPDTLNGVSYSVVEDPIPDNFSVEYQEPIIDKDSRIIEINVTNTIIEKISVPVEKQWVGPATDSVTINLLANGQKIESFELNAKNDWKHVFSNLDKYKDGKEVIYTVDEEDVAGYEKEIIGNMTNGFIIKNVNVEKISVPVEKQWVGSATDSVTINLLANGQKIESFELNAKNDWKHVFSNLDKYKDGKEVIYTVDEEDVAGYEKEIIGNMTNGFIIKNVNVEKISVPVEKQWVGKIGDKAEIILLANNQEVCRKELTKLTQWKYTFTNLPKYDEITGKEIKYTIKETNLNGYETVVKGDAQIGFTVINTEIRKPIVQNNNNSDKPNKAPQTGDYTNLYLWVSLNVISLCGVSIIGILKRKSNNH